MSNQPISWNGNQEFRVVGSGLHEDTLRVETTGQKSSENTWKLVLPTLCITYADMRFQNAVGGEQLNYPKSRVYGAMYFVPAVKMTGKSEVERLTYIRGAESVRIDEKETVIEYFPHNTLIVPRVRIAKKEPATARVEVPLTNIFPDDPLKVKVKQYADGRHIGGIAFEKSHPDWKPSHPKETYDLWITVIDGNNQKPIPKSKVNILHWVPSLETMYGQGGFSLFAQRNTDRNGIAAFIGRPSGDIEVFTVAHPGYRFTPRSLRPLAGQKVRLCMKGWRLNEDKIHFIWKQEETLETIANLTGHQADEILRANDIKAAQLTAAKTIKLPCYAATYDLESWDDMDSIAEWFGYKNARKLLQVNGILDSSKFIGATPLNLPDWHFFFARENDSLSRIDALFDLPLGSSTVFGRVFRANNRLPYQGETVAVPTKEFSEILKKQRLARNF